MCRQETPALSDVHVAPGPRAWEQHWILCAVSFLCLLCNQYIHACMHACIVVVGTTATARLQGSHSWDACCWHVAMVPRTMPTPSICAELLRRTTSLHYSDVKRFNKPSSAGTACDRTLCCGSSPPDAHLRVTSHVWVCDFLSGCVFPA